MIREPVVSLVSGRVGPPVWLDRVRNKSEARPIDFLSSRDADFQRVAVPTTDLYRYFLTRLVVADRGLKLGYGLYLLAVHRQDDIPRQQARTGGGAICPWRPYQDSVLGSFGGCFSPRLN